MILILCMYVYHLDMQHINRIRQKKSRRTNRRCPVRFYIRCQKKVNKASSSFELNVDDGDDDDAADDDYDVLEWE